MSAGYGDVNSCLNHLGKNLRVFIVDMGSDIFWH